MKNSLNKAKITLSTLGTVIMGFLSRVSGEWDLQNKIYNNHVQGIYGVLPPPEPESIAIKIIQILLVAVIFIVGIVSFIKIKKIDDKALKKKKIKNTIIIMILLIIAAFLITKLLIRILTPIPIAYKI